MFWWTCFVGLILMMSTPVRRCAAARRGRASPKYVVIHIRRITHNAVVLCHEMSDKNRVNATTTTLSSRFASFLLLLVLLSFFLVVAAAFASSLRYQLHMSPLLIHAGGVFLLVLLKFFFVCRMNICTDKCRTTKRTCCPAAMTTATQFQISFNTLINLFISF